MRVQINTIHLLHYSIPAYGAHKRMVSEFYNTISREGKVFLIFCVFFLSIGRQVSRAIIMVSNKRRNQTQLFEA